MPAGPGLPLTPSFPSSPRGPGAPGVPVWNCVCGCKPSNEVWKRLKYENEDS